MSFIFTLFFVMSCAFAAIFGGSIIKLLKKGYEKDNEDNLELDTQNLTSEDDRSESEKAMIRLFEEFKKFKQVKDKHTSLKLYDSADLIQKVGKDAGNLFFNSAEKMSESEQITLFSTYTSILSKLNDLLGEDNYIHIVRNKNLYNNPDEKISQVLDVLRKVDEKISRDTKRIYDNDIDLQATLKAVEMILEADEIDHVDDDHQNQVEKMAQENLTKGENVE